MRYVLLVLTLFLLACEPDTYTYETLKKYNGKTLTLTGKVRVVGTAMFPKTVLTVDNAYDVELVSEDIDLMAHYYQEVKIKGVLDVKKLVYGRDITRYAYRLEIKAIKPIKTD